MPENYWKTRRDQLTAKSDRIVSQHKIAVALGVTPALVGLWERDELVPNLKFVPAMADIYQVSAARIEKEIVAQARRMNAAVLAGK